MADYTREHPIITPTSKPRRVLRMKPEYLFFAAASLGIVATAKSAIPTVSLGGLPLGLLALAAGITAMQLTTAPPGFAIVGVTLGALAVVVAISISTSAG